MFGATDRIVRRWLSVYRRNPDIVALLPRQKGQRMGNRRLKPDPERLLGEVIDLWAGRAITSVVDRGGVPTSRGARDQRAALNAIKYLANKLRVSIVAAGTYGRCMSCDRIPRSPVASSSTSFPVWTESQELRRFIAGYLALLPLKKSVEIDKRFVEYLLDLSDGVTARIIEVLRRAAFQGLGLMAPPRSCGLIT
jgi:hypothetical protein